MACVGRGGFFLEGFGQAEVQGLDLAFRRYLDIGGLQIAVDDAFFVGCFEAFGDLAADIQSFIERQWPFGNPLRQSLTFNELQYEEPLSLSLLQSSNQVLPPFKNPAKCAGGAR